MRSSLKASRTQRRIAALAIVLAACLSLAHSAVAGAVSGSYTELPLGTSVDLSAKSAGDWVKWGGSGDAGQTFNTIRQSGVTPIISSTLSLLGSPPSGSVAFNAISGENVLDFDWSDGDSPASGSSDTVVTETILPPQSGFPDGLGVYMTAQADASPRVLDVYVQGYNADILLLALMSGGESDSDVISPTKVISGNDYASGVYRLTYSGVGETLSVSIVTLPPVTESDFPNAGIFAAVIVPEPSALVLALLALAPCSIAALRRLRRASR